MQFILGEIVCRYLHVILMISNTIIISSTLIEQGVNQVANRLWYLCTPGIKYLLRQFLGQTLFAQIEYFKCRFDVFESTTTPRQNSICFGLDDRIRLRFTVSIY